MLYLALVWATQKLMHYFLSHTVHYLAKNDHVRYLFVKATLTERLARWQVLLCEFDLIYQALKTIKGHAIANHLVGLPLEDYGDFPNEQPSLTPRRPQRNTGGCTSMEH